MIREGSGEERERRFQMREDMFSIGEDYWISDEDGAHAYHVDGKAMRFREAFVLEDPSGREVAKIQERKLSIRDKMAIERDGRTIATVRTAAGWGDRYKVEIDDAPDLKAHGKVIKHDYEIERDGRTIARVSKKWFRVRDSYGVEIAPGEDEALILSVVVAIEAMTRRD